jgi:hypothetical protein
MDARRYDVTKARINGWRDGRGDELTDGGGYVGTKGRINEWKDGRGDELTDGGYMCGRKFGLMDGGMEGETN